MSDGEIRNILNVGEPNAVPPTISEVVTKSSDAHGQITTITSTRTYETMHDVANARDALEYAGFTIVEGTGKTKFIGTREKNPYITEIVNVKIV